MNIGHKRWVIADGYIPADSTGGSRELVSHDAVCILNCGAQDAQSKSLFTLRTRSPAGRIALWLKPCAPGICALMSSLILSLCRTIRIMPA